ncbi:MAG: hypothetical protein IJV17_05395 [Prevotella sp.]|nr:hypothetical protein [Prevotella sp.]
MRKTTVYWIISICLLGAVLCGILTWNMYQKVKFYEQRIMEQHIETGR